MICDLPSKQKYPVIVTCVVLFSDRLVSALARNGKSHHHSDSRESAKDSLVFQSFSGISQIVIQLVIQG